MVHLLDVLYPDLTHKLFSGGSQITFMSAGNKSRWTKYETGAV